MYDHAIQLDPEYARAYAGIANCSTFLYIYSQRSEANRERAEQASQKALELDPRLAEAHASRGAALSATGRTAEAEAAFETALRLAPRLYEAHYLYARHAFAKGELETAAREFEQASAARPDDYQAPLLVAQVFGILGRDAEAAAVRRRGLALAEAQLRINPDDVRARYLGANALVALGEHEKGLEWARAARSLDPEEPMLLYNLGCIHALAGDAETALDCLEAAARAGLTEIGWHEHDGDLASLRGHPRFRALVDSLG
jgi:adenylate cyclase